MAESIVQSSTEAVLNVARTERLRVLHVDDDQAFLKVAKQCLEMQGEIDVDTVSSVNEALEKLKKTDYDAIVCDYQMPGKDGLEFLKELRANGNNIPFIVFTGKGREEAAIKALNLGADQYIDKHGDPETVYCELAHSIRTTLRNKRAEDAKRRTDERYRILLESISDSVYVLDREWRHVIVNEAGSRFTHIPVEKLLGNKLTDLFPGVEKTSFFAAFRRVMETRKPETASDKYVFEDGREGWYEVDVYPVPEGILCMSTDITSRKKTEEEIRKSEVILQNIADSVIVTDLQGQITSWNEGASKIFGFSAEEMLGETIAKVSKSKERGQVASAQLEQVRKGVLFSTECEGVRKDGEPVWLMLTTKLLKNSQGETVGMIGVGKDISERKKAEAALRGSEEKWRSLAENAPNIIVIVDRVGTIQFINRTVVNARPEEIVGRSVYDFIDPEHHNVVKKTIEQVFQTGEGGRYGISGVGPKGSVAWYETHAGPIKHDGQTVAVTLITTDLTERRKMEQQLRIKETAVASSVNGVAFADLEGKLTYVNSSFLEMWGYANENEVLGRPAEDFWSSKENAAEVVNALGHKGSWVGDLTAKKKDGSTFEVQLSASTVKDETGKPSCMMGSFLDVTERRKAGQSLKESEEKYRGLVELAPDGVVAVNAEGTVTSVNRSFLKLMGYDSEREIVGKPFTELMTMRKEGIPRFQGMFMSLMKGESASPSEFLYVRRDGASRWAEVHSGLLVKDGKPVGAQVIMRDVSERKKAEKLIHENQQKFEGLFRRNPEAAVYLDLDFKVLDVNPRFCELFGYSAKEVEGKRINEVVVPEDMMEEAETLDKDAKKGYASRDTVRKRKDGSLVHVSISATPVTIEGRLFGYVGVYKDITNLKGAEEHLKEINMKLVVTNEKLHVVGGLARHDVRNKLVAVTGNAYLLRQKLVGDAKALGQLNDMEAAVRLVEEIFEFARIYEKLGVEQLTSMDVGKAVEGAVSLFSGLKGVKMVNECRGLTVLADSLLSQLFYNLIDNSLKYGEKTQQIKVYCKTSSSNQLELVYEDDGVGIPDNVRSNLFKEGFTSGKGTGYGLFMIKRICEVYGWTIQEKGAQGKGARFIMTIPDQRAH